MKVAMRPVASSSETEDALTGVRSGAAFVTMKVVASTVNESMRVPDGTSKDALMVAPGHVPTALAVGLVSMTEIGGWVSKVQT